MTISIKSAQGFTLLESLMALFILTVGILGVASLQVQGIRSSQTALQRTIVVMKTQEIIDRMRANSNWNVEESERLINLATLQAYGGDPQGGGCNSGTVCDGPTQAAHDLSVWQGELASILPSLDGASIVVTPSPVAGEPTTVTVTIDWSDRTDTNLTYSVTVRI